MRIEIVRVIPFLADIVDPLSWSTIPRGHATLTICPASGYADWSVPVSCPVEAEKWVARGQLSSSNRYICDGVNVHILGMGIDMDHTAGGGWSGPSTAVLRSMTAGFADVGILRVGGVWRSRKLERPGAFLQDYF